MADWRRWVGVVGIALAAGCATPPSDARVEAELRRLGAEVRELGRAPRIVVLNAGSQMDAWGKISASQADGPSTRMQALGSQLAKADRRRVGVVMGGPFPQLNDRMVLDALAASGTGPLPGLTLLLVSPEPPHEDVRLEARRRRIRLVHRALHI